MSEFFHFAYQLIIALAGSGGLIYKLILFWNDLKKEHLRQMDLRIATLESITLDHTKHMAVNDAASKALGEKLQSCEAQIAKTSAEIGSVNSDLKKSLGDMGVSILDRLSKDEGTLLVHDTQIKKLGSVILKP